MYFSAYSHTSLTQEESQYACGFCSFAFKKTLSVYCKHFFLLLNIERGNFKFCVVGMCVHFLVYSDCVCVE